MRSYYTCLICFSQFLAAGLTLERIAAFNRKKNAWGTSKTKTMAGSLTVTTVENGDLLKLCAVHDAQLCLQQEFIDQEGAHDRRVSGLVGLFVINDDVVRELIRLCNAHITKVCAEFERTQATCITDMNSM